MSQHQAWRWIDKYPNYSVSTSGEVMHRCWIAHSFKKAYIRGGHILKKEAGKQGYVRVTLYEHDGAKTCERFFVHRLVAEAFIPNPYNKPHVNHKNGIKNDNRLENLEWCTRKENQEHAVANGLYKNPKGDSHRMAKLNEKMVVEIINLYNDAKLTQSQLANKYGVTQETINRVIKRKTWGHVKIN